MIFIAGVINAAAGVKAAVHHLGMTGVKWEEVRVELSSEASQEMQCIGR